MKKLLLFVLLFFVSSQLIFSQEVRGEENVTTDELNRQLENPLSRFWSLIFQENLKFNDGDLVNETMTSNTFNFQPSLPIPIGKSKMLLVRPVFPLITKPIIKDGYAESYETGFGDIQVFSLFGPDKKDGLIWGAGLTFSFPTASPNYLGSGKTQTGPALMLLSITKKWTLGSIIQYWHSIGGDPEREETSQMDIQYIIRKQIQGKGMSIGMGPNINIDFYAEEGNKVTLPIGLGVTKTVLWGSSPWKLRFEPQYSIVKPDNYGTRWTIRIQIAPIVKNPAMKKRKV